MLLDRKTLKQFMLEEGLRHSQPTEDLNALILDVALACKTIDERIGLGTLDGVIGSAATVNIQGEKQHNLDVTANQIFLRTNESHGHVAGMLSEEMAEPYAIPLGYPKGPYLLVFDPLDGSSNIDVNVSVGSIFSILRAPRDSEDPTANDFLQPGSRQVGAGYAIYGPATMLVITVGTGVHAFTLDRARGEFFLTHQDIQIASDASEFAINASNSRFWETPVSRYIQECLAGKVGPRGKDFNMRWIASLVAETHRILMRGGVFLYPRDTKDPSRPGRLRLLYEANPIAFIVEQAGGAASTGRERIRDVVPESLHQRIALIFGASEEVERLEVYHANLNPADYDAPLFGSRGLFRVGG